MKRVPLTNPHSDRALHVGGVVIPAGDTRMVDANAVPPKLQTKSAPAPAPAPEVDPMAELSKKKIDDIVAELPHLDDDQLTALLAIEQAAEKPRKRVLEPITELQLERAKGGDGTDPGSDAGEGTGVGEIGGGGAED
ncbi:MAG TPA: hypothetical protein VFL78_10700 [Rhodanobacteraceae bacterium]|nr:hypothetical protein [Rhodanobacteraceae bacterium]